MIWSMSMLAAGMTTVREVRDVNGSMVGWASRSEQFARVGDPAGERTGGRGDRACEQRAGTGALAPLEVAVAGADGVLPAPHQVAVHPEAHGAAGFAPLRAGIEEHPVKALGLGLALDVLGAGDHQHGD